MSVAVAPASVLSLRLPGVIFKSVVVMQKVCCYNILSISTLILKIRT
jgi:hypothetical protein